jgi:uncharacterized membrane protein
VSREKSTWVAAEIVKAPLPELLTTMILLLIAELDKLLAVAVTVQLTLPPMSDVWVVYELEVDPLMLAPFLVH